MVELFTSEGCHSCPPADRLAVLLSEQAREKDLPVYVLAYHVDYWDRLGWRDPYSSREATTRQNLYAAVWRERSVYTPQMIVNGKAGFVGSDARRASEEINRALGSSPLAGLHARATLDGTGRLLVSVDPMPGLGGRRMNLIAAAVETGLTTEVKRGENAGRKLEHADTVRAFGVAQMGPAVTTAAIDLPGGVEPANTRVIVFAQDAATLEIIAAAAMDLPDRAAN